MKTSRHFRRKVLRRGLKDLRRKVVNVARHASAHRAATGAAWQ
jgi:hypothetical protein